MTDAARNSPSPTFKTPVRSRNWHLVIGGIMVILVILLALFGSLLAPQDPMKTSFVAQLGDRFIRPPFPPGVEGYPLGSDEVGRDILSRLLWAVRPTMSLVLVVVSLRLALGILIGLVAGWSNGRLARWIEPFISSALSVPVLFVALCVVAAMSNRWGISAFILGLSISGWAESARLVQGQTRLVKGYPFIEATRAMGGTAGQVILSHIIPHVMPLMWIQMAFEVSSTLLATAALGFLGYFINAIWVPTDSDWVALRASGMPELGQMLGISSKGQPWQALFAGTVIFVIVLAFNIFGEGLRNQLSPDRRRKRAESTQAIDRAGSWVSERVYVAVSQWRRSAATGGIFITLFILIIGGGWILWHTQNTRIEPSKLILLGGHHWAAEFHDAQGSYWSTEHGPMNTDIVWTYIGPGGVIGGPAINRDGFLYVNLAGRKLAILGPDGRGRKIASLPAEPVGWPALTPEGNVIVADERGHLIALSWDGTLLWEYVMDPPDAGLVSPIVGPSGIIYYPVKNFLVAVKSDGQLLWQIQLPTYSYTSPLPRLSPNGAYLFFEDVGVDAETGRTLFKESIDPADRYLVGADGKVYFRTIDTFMEWQTTENGAVMLVRAKLDPNVINANQRFPFDSGVSPSQNPWLLYSSGFEYLRLVWTDPKGNSPQVINIPYRTGRFIGIDADGVGYVCGVENLRDQVECRAVELSSGAVVWKTSLDSNSPVSGGAIVEGRLYVAVADGKIFAIGK